MTTTTTATLKSTAEESLANKSKSHWVHAWETLCRDKVAMGSMFIVGAYVLMAILSSAGIVAADWNKEIGPSYAPPGSEFFLGLDIMGRSVFLKVIKGAEVALSFGLLASFAAVVIGLFMGSLAGYFGGKMDDFIVWLYTTFSSIPWILLMLSVRFVLGEGLGSMVFAYSLASWVTLCRIVRGEVMRHKERDYVQAATSIGGGHARKLIKHIIPNISHIVIINFSLQFVTAIKAEVILSFLGLGVSDRPSWGIMIDDAKLEISREPWIWWQLLGATVAMFVLVFALNLFGDALRDALDPKLKGKS